MNIKRLISLFIAFALCLSSFTAFAADDFEEEIFVTAGSTEDVIDYSDMSNWAYWNEGSEKTSDVFFVCPTVDMGKDGNFNSDVANEKYRDSFVGAINMELGIYDDEAKIYAPYYRQATFPVYNLGETEREKYLSIAYEDVKNAFVYYADHTDSSRPLILAGFSQGADMIIRLMKDLFDEPKYQRRLVAAYCIGWKLTEDEVREYPHLKPASAETDTGVIVAFNSEDKSISSSLIIGENEKTYSINPLNWKTGAEKADKSLNKGACFTDYSGKVKKEIPNLTGAYIDEKRGALKVTDINPEDYPGKLFEDGIYHLYDYQFFFRNLEENVAKRLFAFNEKYADRMEIFYNEEIMSFEMEPIVENCRTLVPFREIFEAIGCAVDYSEEGGKQIVSARKGSDTLQITIGENKLYFNDKVTELDVPARIKDGKAIVPLRAVSEAFDCDVFWESKTGRIYISSKTACCAFETKKIEETVTDESGNALIEAVAYYPVMHNPDNIPILDKITEEYKSDAEKFIDEAKAKKQDAVTMRANMGNEAFVPFVYELTFEQNYNIMGDVSFTNYKYVNNGGAHPTTLMKSRNFNIGAIGERELTDIIDEEKLGVSLAEYVANLFAEKLRELDPQSAEEYTYEYVLENIGNIQFCIMEKSLVMYFNQGEVAPYALGVISVEIPYDPELFYIDMGSNCLDEYVHELEYDKGYEWCVAEFARDKLVISEATAEYDHKTLLAETYPVGMKKFSVKGIRKGNAAMILAHVKKGEGIESAKEITIVSFYVDENNKITLVSESNGMFLLD